MREFAKSEIIKQKCYICGCRNKGFSELLDDKVNTYAGFRLKCCNCGNVLTFYRDYTDNGTMPPLKVHPGKEKCIKLSFCPHKDCKLYTQGDCKKPSCGWNQPCETMKNCK